MQFAKKPKITCVKKTNIDLRASKKIEDKVQNANNERYDDSDSETDDNYRVQDPIDSEITEVSRVDSDIERAKKEINDLKNENIQLKNLNLNLQTILCREFGVNVMGKENEKENDNGEVLVKLERAVRKINRNNDTVHLGHDVWIPVDKWNSIMINSGKSASLFSRNLSRCIFGEEVLKRSSITGKSSNRASMKETRDRLDPTSIRAVQSAFEFWATTQLKPPSNSVNMQHYKVCIPTYIGKFCDDLRQPPEKWRKKKRVAPLTVEQEEIAKEFDEINSNHPIEEIVEAEELADD